MICGNSFFKRLFENINPIHYGKGGVSTGVPDPTQTRFLSKRWNFQTFIVYVRGIYSMFHVTWTTFKFNRNQMGTVSAYVMWVWLISLLMCTLKWLSSIEIQCHKEFHLKPKAAINYTEISSLICHWYWYNGRKYDWSLSSRLIPSRVATA